MPGRFASPPRDVHVPMRPHDRARSPWSRRAFLAAGAASATAALLWDSIIAAAESSTPPTDLGTWASVRSQFDLDPERMHFASFLMVSHPRPVQQAIDAFVEALDRDPADTIERGLFGDPAENLQRHVRREMAPYMEVEPEDIALTPNTTTGLALVYHGLPLAAGDEVLTTAHDHFVHHESIRLATERAGATLRKVRLYEHGARAHAGEMVERITRAIGPATRVVGITWVHSSSGVRLPIRAIADALGEVNRSRDEATRIRLVVDGVHGFGVTDEPVGAMGCDFFAAGTHKWMFAPRGTGLLWGRAAEWRRLRPTIPSFSAPDAFLAWKEGRRPGPTTAAHVTPGGFLPYEHQWAAGAAFRMHRTMGRDRVAKRIETLNDRLKAGLSAMRRVHLRTPLDPALSAGMVAFEVEGLSADEVVGRLGQRRIVASPGPYRESFARLAPSLVNDEAEVDAALRAVRDMAGA